MKDESVPIEAAGAFAMIMALVFCIGGCSAGCGLRGAWDRDSAIDAGAAEWVTEPDGSQEFQYIKQNTQNTRR